MSDRVVPAPESDPLGQAVEQFRASGGTPEQLTVFSRIVASGRLRYVDLDHLARTLRVDLDDDTAAPHAP